MKTSAIHISGKIINLSFVMMLLTMILILFLLTGISRDGTPATGSRARQAFDRATRKSRLYEASIPDSAIKYSDSAISLMYQLAVKDDSAFASLLLIKAGAYMAKDDPDQALKVIHQARSVAASGSNPLTMAKTSLRAGAILSNRGNPYVAETCFLEAISIYERLGRDYEKGLAFNGYGHLCMQGDNIVKARKYLMEACVAFKRSDSLKALSNACFNMAISFKATGNITEELQYFRIAANCAEQAHDTFDLVTSLTGIGMLYQDKNPDSAAFFYRRVVALNPSGKMIQPVIMARCNLAGLPTGREDIRKAGRELQNLLEICTREANYTGMALVCNSLSLAYGKLHNDLLAIRYLKQSIRLYDSTGQVALALTGMASLQNYYKREGSYKGALLLAEQIKKTGDSLRTRDNRQALYEMEPLNLPEEARVLTLLGKSREPVRHTGLSYPWRILFTLFLLFSMLLMIPGKHYRFYRKAGLFFAVPFRKQFEDKPHTIESSFLAFSSTGIHEQKVKEANPDLPLIERLHDYFTTEKPYLDPKLKVALVAEKLETSPKAIAHALNQHNSFNFNTFTNRFRVEEAKQRMEDVQYQNYKIEFIARDSGFGSKQSFYTAFEQFTGIKPGNYRNNVLNKTGPDHFQDLT